MKIIIYTSHFSHIIYFMLSCTIPVYRQKYTITWCKISFTRMSSKH